MKDNKKFTRIISIEQYNFLSESEQLLCAPLKEYGQGESVIVAYEQSLPPSPEKTEYEIPDKTYDWYGKDNNESPEKGVKTAIEMCKLDLEPAGSFRKSTLVVYGERCMELMQEYADQQPANNDYTVKENQWKPISEAPKDGTGIEVYWFVVSSFYFVQWDDEALVWSNVYYDKDIPGHITKAIWRPIIRPEYKDYEHLFITPNN